MRIAQADLLISPMDLAQFLAPFAEAEGITGLRIRSESGALTASFDYKLGVKFPVDLTLAVAGVRPDQVELAVALKAGVGIPGPMVRKLLEHVVGKLGIAAIKVEASRLVVNVDELGPYVQAWFRVRRLAFTADGIEVGLDDLARVPLDLWQEPEGAATPPALAPGDRTVPPEEHRGFYDRLRQKLEGWAGDRVPERYRFLVPWLLLLPDLFALLGRLVADGRVSATHKVRLALVIAYVINPIDLIPDLVPLAGVVDDLALVLLALAALIEDAPREVLLDHWPGQAGVVGLVTGGLQVLKPVAGGLVGRLAQFLAPGKGEPT